jgi:hypothetical protein
MNEIKIAWMIASTIVAAWLNFTVLINPILCAAMDKWGNANTDRMSLILLIVLEIFHLSIAIAVCLFVSVSAAVVVTSLIGFGWALVSYFLLQRFVNRFERCLRVLKNQIFHPLVAFGGFISSTFAIIFLADWRWAFSPVVLWLVLGFFCAEIAIRNYMRKSKQIGEECDRNMAIFVVNNAQGRRNSMFFEMKNRYPFP